MGRPWVRGEPIEHVARAVDPARAQPGHAGAADVAAARTLLRRRGGGAAVRYAGPGTATAIPRTLDPAARVLSPGSAPGAARSDDRARHAHARHVAPDERGRLRRTPPDL